MQKIRKALAFILSIVISLSFMTVIGFGEENKPINKTEYPIIFIRGDGEVIFNNENIVYPVKADPEKLPGVVKDVIFPHLVNALFKNEWDGYYDAFEGAINRIFAKAHLDSNGEASDGSGVNKFFVKIMDNSFSLKDYQNTGMDEEISGDLCRYYFHYDWRIDPFVNADLLHERVEQLKETYNTDKVNFHVRCLGGTILMAYLQRYGSDEINAIFADSCILNGSELVGDMFTGNIRIGSDSAERFAYDWQNYFDGQQGKEMLQTVLGVLKNLIILMNSTDGIKGIDSLFQKFYAHIKDELVPRLIMATFGTFPNYWDMIPLNKYEQAKNYVFNTAEKKQEYAGLIAKSDYFHENVLAKYDEIISDTLASGTKIGAVSKYGYQTVPVCPMDNMLGDDTVTVSSSGFGTTTARNITSVFDDNYIQDKVGKGLGKYISPDKQIDASTSVIKDQIWYIKGSKHSNFVYYDDLKIKFFNSYGTLTVDDDPIWTQFLVFNDENKTYSPMSEGNCQPGQYESGKKNKTSFVTVLKNFAELISRVFKLMISLIKKAFTK